ncbi:protein kinase [bacterium]|nr:protein kinase [bacterium]
MTDELDDTLQQLLDRWLDAVERGEQPILEDVCRDHPEYQDRLAAMVRRLGDFDRAFGFKEIETGRYTLRDFYRGGGLGQVYLADDGELDRRVVVKVMRSDRTISTEALQAFVAEAKVTASLDHPGIIPVYGFGMDPAGRPYYAMRFVRGMTYQEAIAEYHDRLKKGPVDQADVVLQRRLREFLSVCQTIAFAHHENVIHRDLKPANILIGPYGEVLVADWGLAKSTIESAEAVPVEDFEANGNPLHTQPGQIKGSPSYLSPEQAAGLPEMNRPAIDVYGLGAILYELITARPPHPGESTEKILEQVLHGRPTPPRQINPLVSRSLEAICLNALQHRPEDRYGSAAALAADIERELAGEPVSVYEEPVSRRVGRWISRHRTPAAAIATAMVIGLTILAIVSVLLSAKNNELAQTNQQLDEARQNLTASLAQSRILLAQQAWDVGDTNATKRLLEGIDEHHREFEWHFLSKQLNSGKAELCSVAAPIFCLLTDRSGSIAAVGSPISGAAEDQLFLYRSSGKEFGNRVGRLSPIPRGMVAMSKDGRYVAMASADDQHGNCVDVWEVATKHLLRSIPIQEYKDPAFGLFFSQDGRLHITSRQESTTARERTKPIEVVTWDLAKDSPISTKEVPSPVAETTLLSDDGQTLLLVEKFHPADEEYFYPQSIRIWDLKQGRQRCKFTPGSMEQPVVAIDSNGRRFATSLGATGIAIVDCDNGRILFSAEQPGDVTSLAFDPTGKQIASGGKDRIVRVWEIVDRNSKPKEDADANEIAPVNEILAYPLLLRGCHDAISAIAFVEGDRVLAADHSGQVIAWDLRQLQPKTIAGITKPVFLQWADNQLVSENLGGTIEVFDSGTWQRKALPGELDFTAAVHGYHFSIATDARQLAVMAEDGVQICDLTSMKKTRFLKGFQGPLAFGPTGNFLAMVRIQYVDAPKPIHEIRDHVVLYDLREDPPKLVHEWVEEGHVTSLRMTGDKIVTTDLLPRIICRQIDRDTPIWTANVETSTGTPELFRPLAIDPTGKTVAAACGPFQDDLGIWQLESGKQIANSPGHHRGITVICYSPDGQRIATAGKDKSVRIWDSSTGQQLLELPRLNQIVWSLAFSPDGRTLVGGIGLEEGELVLWNTKE